MPKPRDLCEGLSFSDCELAILRHAVDKAGENQKKQVVNSPEIKKIIGILEYFIKKKGVICYGGSAINALLPKQDQFYNMDVEIPDYDFYSPNALKDAKELVDLYVKSGFVEVEGKSGQHFGTYKVFVNFIPIADITFIPGSLFKAIKRDSVRIGGILYAPPNLLRMAMYLELSRPAGDVSRWEKVLKRLTLLNKHYPLEGYGCFKMDFQRSMSTNYKANDIYENVQKTLIDQGVIFFGGYAISLYSKYMPPHLQKKLQRIPDFDVLTEEPRVTAEIVKERLHDIGIKDVKIIKRPSVGEIIAPHYEIQVGKDTIAFIYEPLACHSYNKITEDGQEIKIATIDTMLSFYLAFLYADRPYYDKRRILCMSQYLFEVQEKNRLEQKGLLKRFSIDCVGHQTTVEEMRAEKAQKYSEYKHKKNSIEYERWFLRYRPTDKIMDTKIVSEEELKKQQKKTKGRKKRKNRTKKKRGFFF